MFGKPHAKIALLFLLFSSVCNADTRTDTPSPLFGDIDGTNAGRYRSVKFSNGSTTNNGDGSVSVSTGGGGSQTPWAQNIDAATFKLTNVGNVGIGTNQLTASLTIQKNGLADYIHINSTAGTGGDKFIITNGGNIGIGSLVPGTKLDVNGTVRATGIIDTGLFGAAPLRSDGNKQIAEGTYSGNTTVVVSANGALSSNNILIADADGNAQSSNFQFGSMTDTKTCTVATGSPNVISCTSSGGGSQTPWTANEDAAGFQLTNVANVGVGTNAAPASLTIQKNGSVDYLHVNSAAGTGGDVFLIKNGGNVGLGTTLNKSNLAVKGGVSIGPAYGDKTALSTGDLIVVGNVGIGTWAPTNSFVVANGGAAVVQIGNGGQVTATQYSGTGSSPYTGTSGTQSWGSNSSTGGSNLTLIGGASTSSHLDFRSTTAAGVGNEYIDFANGNNGATRVMRIQSGNVGIGTVAPLQKFTIVGNVGISTTGASEVSTGFDGKGATSCICTQFKSGWCVAGSCT